jgi:hypothetical protein
MGEWLKLIILIVLGGVCVTLAAWLAAFFLAEERRLARAFRQGLQTQPDAALIAHGAGRGIAISLAARRVVTAWDGGGWRLTYPLDELLGAELDLDGDVAARVMRGEPRRLLDGQSGAEREVRLRLLFDDARHPDFELVLWPSAAHRAGPTKPRDAIAEANRWIARIESVLRKTGGALTLAKAPPAAVGKPVRAPHPPAPDLFSDDDDPDEDDEGPPWREDDEDELAE